MSVEGRGDFVVVARCRLWVLILWATTLVVGINSPPSRRGLGRYVKVHDQWRRGREGG